MLRGRDANLELGQALAKIAYALPPIQLEGLALANVVVAIIFGTFATIVFGLRLYVRLGLSRVAVRAWGIDDTLLTVGFLPYLACIALATLACLYGLGYRDMELPTIYYEMRVGEYYIYWVLCYIVSSALVKCAIAFVCWRLDTRKWVRIPILLNTVIMGVASLMSFIFVFVDCKPLATHWNPPLGTCQTTISLAQISYILSSFQMGTDVFSAGMPFIIVARLQMPRRKKISVIGILGLGVLASVATCVRMPYLKYYDLAAYPVDYVFHMGIIMLLSNIECGLGIIACALPPLHKLFKYYYGTSVGQSKQTSPDTSATTPSSARIKLGNLKPNGSNIRPYPISQISGEWDRLDDELCHSSEELQRRADSRSDIEADPSFERKC